MIRHQRARHRRLIPLLAVFLPALFLASLVLRPERPVVPADAAWGGGAAPANLPVGPASRHELPAGEGTLEIAGPEAGRVALRLDGPLAEVEILAYVSARPAAWEGDWLDEAWLLGVLRGGRTIVAELPREIRGAGGSIRLLDLARDRELEPAPLVPAQAGGA